ncbi:MULTISPECIES: hypothetical protein [unclassified Microcoleus]|uniref:hypothetical protein n=1 Tax=unclassified Microcoleus TaxID=2642155 RepID=UPI0025F150B0|nr:MULTISPECIES: hypothetical protein [unclassified Microcoleus]
MLSTNFVVPSKTEVVSSNLVGASLRDFESFLGIIHGDTPYKHFWLLNFNL